MLRRFRPDARVVTVEARREGQHGTVFRLRCDRGDSLVVKLQRPGREDRLFDDLHALEIAARADVPTPTVIGVDETREVLPWTCAVLEDLGQTLPTGREDQLTRSELTRFSRELGRGLGALHDVILPRFGAITERSDGEFSGNREYMLTRFDVALAKFADQGGHAGLLERARERVDERADLFDQCEQAVFCHMDCHEANIAVREADDGVHFAGLIDFGSAAACDPVCDIAKTHYMARRGCKATLDALIAGHGGMPDNWRPRFDLYTLLHAIELWSWFAGNDWQLWGKPYERDVRRLLGGVWRRPARGVR